MNKLINKDRQTALHTDVRCKPQMQDSVRIHLEKALGRDAEFVWSSWASDLETLCLLCQDGTDGTSLENKC